MKTILITNARIVNEGKIIERDILIKDRKIYRIGQDLSNGQGSIHIEANGNYLLPGLIDDQVHFREPGLTHKATIFTESRAAVAGGVTSYMEMPNTVPQTLTQKLLEEKYVIAQKDSLANYSFYMGASNDNMDEILNTDPREVCGLKVFMGSSTGNMLVDDQQTLENIFSQTNMLIATHCEDESIIRDNAQKFRERYGEEVPFSCHPLIRSAEACYESSSKAVSLAQKYQSRLHVLHISTARELELFDNKIPLKEKKITAEACIHHLWFDQEDYQKKGSLIKWNPAVKTTEDKLAVFEGILSDRIDVIATDHAPHTLAEKSRNYFEAPSGGPLIQHSLVAMLEFYKQGKITLEKIVEKMCHNPSILFSIDRRGYIREGYYADLVLVNLEDSWKVENKNILAKCGWSPFEGQEFSAKVTHTIVSGHLAYQHGMFNEHRMGERLAFVSEI
ncbi:MAG: dihydroorotase [Bacteroidetes bacterium]|nr:dihydroorotase [Bacteroidota bacterium]